MIQDPMSMMLEDPAYLYSRAMNKFHSLWLARTYPFASFGKRVSIDRSCVLQRSMARHVSIGDGVVLHRDVWIFIAPTTDCTTKDIFSGNPIVIIEDGCNLNRGSIIIAKNRVHIKKNVIFGPSVFITDHSHAYEDVTVPIGRQGITQGGTICIEEGSWIGFGAAVICNQGELVIGRNSVIGANSLVSRSVNRYSIAVGNPTRTVKHYDLSKEKWVLGGSTQTEDIS